MGCYHIGLHTPPPSPRYKRNYICRRTSDSRTCHTAVSDSRWRLFLFDQWDQSAHVNPL